MGVYNFALKSLHFLEVAPLLNLIANWISLCRLTRHRLLWLQSQELHVINELLIGGIVLIVQHASILTLSVSENVWSLLFWVFTQVFLLVEPFLQLVIRLQPCTALIHLCGTNLVINLDCFVDSTLKLTQLISLVIEFVDYALRLSQFLSLTNR